MLTILGKIIFLSNVIYSGLARSCIGKLHGGLMSVWTIMAAAILVIFKFIINCNL